MNITETYIMRILELQNNHIATNDDIRPFDHNYGTREWFWSWHHIRSFSSSFYEAFRFYASYDGVTHSLYRVTYYIYCDDLSEMPYGAITITENHPDFALLETVFNQLIERNKQ